MSKTRVVFELLSVDVEIVRYDTAYGILVLDRCYSQLPFAYKWYHDNGYLYAYIEKKTISMHRAIFGIVPGQSVDHIDGNRLNNTAANLRSATKSQNAANSKKRAKNGKGRALSRYKGVTLWRSPHNTTWWRARITVNYKSIGLGYFKDEVEAAKAYDAGALKYFGEYAKGNFI